MSELYSPRQKRYSTLVQRGQQKNGQAVPGRLEAREEDWTLCLRRAKIRPALRMAAAAILSCRFHGLRTGQVAKQPVAVGLEV